MKVMIELTEKQQESTLRAIQTEMREVKRDLKDREYPSSLKPLMRRHLAKLMEAYEALLP